MSGTHSRPRASLPGVALMLPIGPSRETILRVESEYRHIFARLSRRGCGEKLEVQPPLELMMPSELGTLLDAHPGVCIVHLCGSNTSLSPLLDEEIVAGFAMLDEVAQLDCVVLDVHHSSAQAEQIAQHVQWVVAMPTGTADTVVTAFAGHFYVALALGDSIDDAFETGLAGTKLAFVAQGRMPKLYQRKRAKPRARVPSPYLPAPDAPLMRAAAPSSGSQVAVSAPATRSRPHPAHAPEHHTPSTPLPLPPIPISEEESKLLLELIEEHAGIRLAINSDRFLLRLSSRLRDLGLDSYHDYYHYLYYNEKGPEEMEELIERITTHETYFFREQYQLDALSEQILPALAKRLEKDRRLRIWSAGCSTGEEVYTLAILLLESKLFTHWDISLLGTDISQRVIETARAGFYGENSFRTISARHRELYFTDAEGRAVVRQDLREMCRFETLNLMETEHFAELGTLDIILCRNVLIYLSPETRQRAVSAFYQQLRSGGYMLLGHSESLLGLKTRFDLAQMRKSLVYRKPGW